ncbi:MAG: VanZ family protein [Desulfuromonadaceae bacterium]|nr:VanZ family protein [Desulfuromonadaceae bacterium]
MRKAVGAAYLTIVAFLSLMPSRNIPDIPQFPGADKLVHICMYLGLSFLACWICLEGRHQLWFMCALLGAVFMYGALMEILQRTMHNGRSFDFNDMAANLVGAIIGVLIYRFLDRMRMKKAGG